MHQLTDVYACISDYFPTTYSSLVEETGTGRCHESALIRVLGALLRHSSSTTAAYSTNCSLLNKWRVTHGRGSASLLFIGIVASATFAACFSSGRLTLVGGRRLSFNAQLTIGDAVSDVNMHAHLVRIAAFACQRIVDGPSYATFCVLLRLLCRCTCFSTTPRQIACRISL